MTLLPLWARLAGSATLLVLLAALLWRAGPDHARLARLDDARRACTAAVAKADGDSVAKHCDAAIVAASIAARAAAACDAALLERPRNDYTVRAACSTAVKAQVARADVAAANLADTQAQLTAARSATDAAVARAEARGVTTARRTADADHTLAHVPQRADGLLRCDAGCLRALAGTAAAASR